MNSQSRILIVDDNPTNLKVLSATLSELQYSTLAANTGERGITAARQALPDLILLDINLPGMNGYDVCRVLKSSPETSEIPIIFISAMDDVQSKVEGFRAGGVDYVTKPFNREEVAVRVETHLKIRRMTLEMAEKNRIVEERNEEITDSIQYAVRIQQSIMPDRASLQNYFPDSFIFFQPHSLVSGDFYWFHQRRNKIFVAAADCTGHGVPGALVSLVGINALNKLIEERGITEPASVLEELNLEIQSTLNRSSTVRDGMDITLCAFDVNRPVVQFAAAMRTVYHVSNGVLMELKGDRHSIGGTDSDFIDFTNQRIELSKGDCLYLFTDGITDQFGGDQKRKFTPKRFQQFLQDIHTYPMEYQHNLLQEEFLKWKGALPQTDDILVIGIRYNGA